jgi:hypothetical protein
MEALRILWENGASKPAEIQARFQWEIDNGTLHSTLVNLVHKKHAMRELASALKNMILLQRTGAGILS